MPTDIPALTDEFRREESASLPSRRWFWSPWTWLSVLVCLIGLLAWLETRVLQHEVAVAEQLRLRNYNVEYHYGWLRRLISFRWRPSARIWGDRIVQLQVELTASDLEPLDDFVPQLRRLGSLQVIHFQNFSTPNGVSVGETPPPLLPSDKRSIRRCLSALQQVGGVKHVCLTGFQESQLSDEFVQCLQAIDVEHVMLFACRCHDEDILRLQALPRLNRLSLVFGSGSANTYREFQKVRPDVAVNRPSF